MNLSRTIIGLAIVTGIIAGILIDVKKAEGVHVIQIAEAATTTPKEVRIEVVVNWTKERIEKEVRTVFWEDPETAVKIAKCESGMRAIVQSHHTLSYGQERSFGTMQVHEPDWADDAERLGLHEWRTDPAENLKLARFIYDSAEKKWTPWSCYTKKMI